MAPSSPPRVPDDLWICGHCWGPIEISRDPTHCPFDGHPRDYNAICCKNPGDAPARGLFPDHPSHEHQHTDRHGEPSNQGEEYSNPWVCNECNMIENTDWYTNCPNCGAPQPSPNSAAPSQFATSSGTGSVASGSWTCDECGCPNGILDISCPACGNKIGNEMSQS
jgi:rubrerythrin